MRARSSNTVKVTPWQCLSSVPAPPQGAPRGSRQLGAPRLQSFLKTPCHCLGCSSYPPPKPLISPPLTVQEENSTEMNVAVSKGKKSQVGADVGRFGHVGFTTKRNEEIEVTLTLTLLLTPTSPNPSSP